MAAFRPTRTVCDNPNHTRLAAPVRHCPQCGGVVNAEKEQGACEEAKHVAARRRQNLYCTDCGAQLTA